MRDHLVVGCEILDLVAQVRILVPQPTFAKASVGRPILIEVDIADIIVGENHEV